MMIDDAVFSGYLRQGLRNDYCWLKLIEHLKI